MRRRRDSSSAALARDTAHLCKAQTTKQAKPSITQTFARASERTSPMKEHQRAKVSGATTLGRNGNQSGGAVAQKKKGRRAEREKVN